MFAVRTAAPLFAAIALFAAGFAGCGSEPQAADATNATAAVATDATAAAAKADGAHGEGHGDCAMSAGHKAETMAATAGGDAKHAACDGNCDGTQDCCKGEDACACAKGDNTAAATAPAAADATKAEGCDCGGDCAHEAALTH